MCCVDTANGLQRQLYGMLAKSTSSSSAINYWKQLTLNLMKFDASCTNAWKCVFSTAPNKGVAIVGLALGKGNHLWSCVCDSLFFMWFMDMLMRGGLAICVGYTRSEVVGELTL